MEYIVLFFTHSGAIKFQRKCKKEDIACELMPVPRVLSSNCSISARIKINNNIEDLIDDEIEEIYSIENDDYKLIYQGE